jgi:nitroimidazol reductase NimA-like FMN-containing flavoprotein (pyridoxamine 5'-phosphate oxidase superfamily)
MTTDHAAAEIEEVSREECLALLRSNELGRLVTIVRALPHVIPVNYVLDDDRIIFRTDHGVNLDAIEGGRVAFEVDDIDRSAGTGWSVVVQGRAEEMPTFDGPARRRSLRDLGVEPWAPGNKLHWIAIHPLVITGRRIRSASDANPTGQAQAAIWMF